MSEERGDVRIRPATTADGAAVAAIYRPYVETTPVSFELEAPTAREMARRIEQTTRTHPWLVAEQEGAPVGYAYATRAQPRAAYAWAAEVSVYLSADAAGRGIGGALLDRLLTLLVNAGFVTALAGTTLPNDASIRLFESRGFELVGVFTKTGYKLGKWHDVGWWQLVLSEDPGPPRALPSA
jgi:L-amino acid N-acyltransferase YncA